MKSKTGSTYDFRSKDATHQALRAEDDSSAEQNEHPKPTYPANHEAGMRVTKGGSSCSNCKYVEGQNCTNPYFIKWNNGSSEIPAPTDEYCSDWWEPQEESDENKNG